MNYKWTLGLCRTNYQIALSVCKGTYLYIRYIIYQTNFPICYENEYSEQILMKFSNFSDTDSWIHFISVAGYKRFANLAVTNWGRYEYWDSAAMKSSATWIVACCTKALSSIAVYLSAEVHIKTVFYGYYRFYLKIIRIPCGN